MTAGTRQGHGITQASASLFQANKKMAPPSGFVTSGSHAIVNVVNKRDNCTTSGWHQGPSSSPSYFCFQLIWWMLLQIWWFREMPLQFPNFEKCHFMPFLVAFFEVWSGVFQSLQTEVAFFKVCKNCSGIFQSLEIAVEFLWIAIIGVAFI